MDDAPTPLTAASAAECRTLTERHPLIHGHVPDMYRFHPTLGAQNCVPQKMQGSTQHPLFFPKDCFANDGGWETYVHDLNFPSDLDRFPPSPPPSPAPPPPPFGFQCIGDGTAGATCDPHGDWYAVSSAQLTSLRGWPTDKECAKPTLSDDASGRATVEEGHTGTSQFCGSNVCATACGCNSVWAIGGTEEGGYLQMASKIRYRQVFSGQGNCFTTLGAGGWSTGPATTKMRPSRSRARRAGTTRPSLFPGTAVPTPTTQPGGRGRTPTSATTPTPASPGGRRDRERHVHVRQPEQLVEVLRRRHRPHERVRDRASARQCRGRVRRGDHERRLQLLRLVAVRGARGVRAGLHAPPGAQLLPERPRPGRHRRGHAGGTRVRHLRRRHGGHLRPHGHAARVHGGVPEPARDRVQRHCLRLRRGAAEALLAAAARRRDGRASHVRGADHTGPRHLRARRRRRRAGARAGRTRS